MTDKSDTRDLILNAAMERILHYGYAKTTMSEIARDCDMSAGNIYRFFAAKIDIAEAMARKVNAEMYQELARITRLKESASDRLRGFFNHTLHLTFAKLDKDAKILEVAEILGKERPEFINEELAQERVYLSQIINDGVKTGEFAPVSDANFASEMMQCALMKYSYPQLWTRLTLPKLQRELDGVMDMLLAGLKQGAKTPETVNAE